MTTSWSSPTTLRVELLSDTTFGRGEGTPGVVDVEVEHDACGLPFVGGKTLHGLIHDAWLCMRDRFPALKPAEGRVLGVRGDVREAAIVRVGDGVVQDDVRRWVRAAQARRHYPVAPEAILATLTAIRSQTAQDRASGAPAAGTLRSIRVAIRGLVLSAPLHWLSDPTVDDLRCLALCALGVRHAGVARNRGLGHVRLTLDGDLARTAALASGR
jgi:hypothetical protein